MDLALINSCIADIEQFMAFVDCEKPVLTAKQGTLGKKDAFRLNQKLNYNKDVSTPYYTQDRYPALDLAFSLVLDGGLYFKGEIQNKPALVQTPLCESFKDLNPYEKYVFLLQTYWTGYDFESQLGRYGVNSLYYLLERIANSKAGQKLLKDERDRTYRFYSDHSVFLHHLRFFGWGELELIKEARFRYDDSIRAFIPNKFGVHTSRFLISIWESDDNKSTFEQFRCLFSDGLVRKTIEKIKTVRTGVYIFKVKLSNRIWRKIRLSHRHTLDDLHMAIQEAFHFGNDHLYAFYIGGNQRTGKPIYSPDVEDAEVDTLDVTIADLGLFVGQSLFYLFDFGDKWTFEVKLEAIENAPLPLKPFVVESKGEAPKQYPDYSEWEG